MNRLVATKEAPPPRPRAATAVSRRDIRRSKPYLLARTPLRSLVFRARQRRSPDRARPASPSALGLYGGARAARGLLRAHADPLGRSSGGRGGATGFPFVALVTVLVFWQARPLRAARAPRRASAAIVSSLVVVALLVLAFGARHRARLRDLRADPDRARDHRRARRACFRASYDVDQPRGAARCSASAGARSSSARASTSTTCCGRSARCAAGSTTTSSASSAASPTTTLDAAAARPRRRACARCSPSTRPTS